MPAGTEWMNPAITATAPPMVAPTSGIRSAMPTNSAISPAKGTPRTKQDDVGEQPQMKLMSRLPEM